MSHYIYKKKAFLETNNGKILPLCLYADSSITSKTYDRFGRCHYYHPRSWCVNTLSIGGLLVDKNLFNEVAKKEYEDELKSLQRYIDKSESTGRKADGESYSYYGTVYPGGGKMKNMKSFYSTRRTVPVEEFLKNHNFSLKIESYDTKTFKTIKQETVFIRTENDLIYAQEVYEKLKEKYGYICIGVYGLPE